MVALVDVGTRLLLVQLIDRLAVGPYVGSITPPLERCWRLHALRRHAPRPRVLRVAHALRGVPTAEALNIHYNSHMKTITINVSEPVYAEYRRAARAMGRPTSELIREAMEAYRRNHLTPREDLGQFQPVSLGRVLRPLVPGDDLLAEMLDGR